MSRENVAALKAVYAEWAAGNFSPGQELFAADVSFEPISDGREILDRDGIDPYMRGFLTQWSEFHIDLQEMKESGDTVLVTERQHGTGISSGVKIEMRFFAAWTFRDGMISRVRWDTDRVEALRAAGLPDDL